MQCTDVWGENSIRNPKVLGAQGALHTAHSPLHPVTPDVSAVQPTVQCFHIMSLEGLCREQSRELVSSSFTWNSIVSAPNTNLCPVWYYAAAFVEVMAFLWNKDGPKVRWKINK